MSNYKYLKNIVEKIAKKGKVPKGNIADTMKYARMESDRMKYVDDYVHNRLQNWYDKDKNLKQYIEDTAFSKAEDRYLDSLDPFDEPSPRFSAEVHNKYNKYLPIRSRIREREELLEDLIRENYPNTELGFPNGDINKARLYEALLEKLKKHPLYNERNNLDRYI